jgi:DNA-binding transcriptional ArsR family regulator
MSAGMTMTTKKNAASPKPANDTGAELFVLPGLAKADKRRSEAKWSAAVMKLGYTPLPSLLLRAQAKLNLKPEHLNTLLQIMEHWWEADKMPFPSKETLARRMGKSPRMVQRYLTDLEDAGHIKRVERFNGRNAQVSNYYEMTGLVEKLKALEPEFRKAAEQNKLRRKKVETPAGEGT